MNTRRQAAFAVARWLAARDDPAGALPDGPERAFVQDLAYVTVRRFRPLRAVLGQLLKKWPKGELEALLLVGAAQILYMPDVPDFAAVNETVEAAKACANPNVARVVNGALRNLLRRRAEFEARLAAAPLAERESFPDGLVARWIARWGETDAARLCAWHNEPAETWLARRDGSFEKLPRGTKVPDAPGYAAGEFVVQDPATAGAVDLLDLRPGQRALDFCAAPGGKAIQIAWRLGGGRVVAREVNPRRAKRLRANLARCRLDWVAVAGADDLRADGPGAETFDRVLVDAPCSNTGVLRCRPDARWNWSPAKLAELAALQGRILREAARFVAPGGLLVYSTCSNEPEENGGVVAAFLAEDASFSERARRESVPFASGHDGAFACALQKTLPSGGAL